MSDVILFRDAAYGACAVLHGAAPRSLITIDHGMAESDFETLLAVVEARADLVRQDENIAEWRLRAHPLEVTSSINAAMRANGYTDDPLAEKAILRVVEAQARAPDLPSAELMEVRLAAVRVGLASIAALVEKTAGLKESKVSVGIHPRPFAADVFGDPLPFMRVQVEGVGLDKTAVQQGVRQAFSHHPGVVRITAAAIGEGRIVVEAAFAPPLTLVETFEARELPNFRDPGHGLVREARFALPKPLPEDVAADLRERATASGAALEIVISERVVRVAMPCSQTHTTDLSNRIRWVHEQLKPWGGSLIEVGELQEAGAVDCAKE